MPKKRFFSGKKKEKKGKNGKDENKAPECEIPDTIPQSQPDARPNAPQIGDLISMIPGGMNPIPIPDNNRFERFNERDPRGPRPNTRHFRRSENTSLPDILEESDKSKDHDGASDEKPPQLFKRCGKIENNWCQGCSRPFFSHTYRHVMLYVEMLEEGSTEHNLCTYHEFPCVQSGM
jgi:hypothetical protein